MSGKSLVLFICTANSARSQMAEALFRHRAGHLYRVASAGTRPAETIHPLALRVLSDAGIPIDGQRPKRIDEALRDDMADHVITVCSGAAEQCPMVGAGALTREHWPLDDPAAAERAEAEAEAVFRATRDEIDRRIRSWLASRSEAENAPDRGCRERGG